MSALGNAVLCVLVGASQDHVIDVAAGRVVAQVENDKGASGSLVSRDVTMRGFPCDPVGIPHFFGISDCSVSGFVELAALKDLTGALQEARAFLGFQFADQSFLKCLVMVCHEIDPFELLERWAFGCWVQVEGSFLLSHAQSSSFFFGQDAGSLLVFCQCPHTAVVCQALSRC